MARIAKPVVLSVCEKAELTRLLKKGTHKSRKLTRARALLSMDNGEPRLTTQSALDIDANHYYRIKKRYLAGGLPNALEERPRSGQPAIVTAALEAHITSIACSDAPEGSSCWTLALLSEKVVELKYVEKISKESVRQILKKANLSLG
jgi:putative transposase